MSTALATYDAPGTVPTVSFEQLEKMALAVSKSQLFACRTPEQAMTLMLLCQAEGLHPIQALRQYHIIEGKPSMRADAIQARFQQNGGKVRWLKRTDAEVSAEFSHPDLQPDPITVTWDNAKVRQAGLDRGNHQKYPLAMKSARVISEGVRAIMPGVVVGLYTPEEVQDFDEPAPPRGPKKVPSTTVTRQDEDPKEPEAVKAPEPEPFHPLAEDTAFLKATQKAAYDRGISAGEFDEHFPALLTKLGGLDKMPVGVRVKVVDDIAAGRADKWKAPQQQPTPPPDDAAQAPAPEEPDVPHQDEPPAYTAADLAVMGEKDFATLIWNAADDSSLAEPQVKAGVSKFAHGKGKSVKSLTGPEKLELYQAVTARGFDWASGQVRETAAAGA